ncbi:MAG: alkaline phosphatase D family protein [Actinomycetota bacterium]|nr:alkaline phosphatase D family protein [Actinomycetota bacterium]
MRQESFEHVVDLEGLDGSKRLGRRSFLVGALATGAAISAPVNYAAIARNRRLPLAKEGAFKLGVSSGFPRPKGITLWTQLDGIKRSAKLKLTVATDRKFGNVVEERLVTARKESGFTARTFVRGLKPHEEYFYRFTTEDSKSQVGRFRTAPPLNSKQKIRIAFYSCQNYEAGFFNAQRAIASEDVDLIICLGDYIYEYSNASGVRLDRSGNNRDGDTQLLSEYRQKYELYKSDRDLKAMHASAPLISIWDDHEVEDNHADGRPSSAQPDPNKTNLKDLPRRISFLQRRANGYKAFFDYQPRMRFKGDRNRIYEDYRLGGLVDLILTDERQYRDQQPCNDAILADCPTANDPRTLLGAKQRDWLLRSLKASSATWKVWGTEVMLMGLRIGPSVVAQVDSWDGYGFERRQILDYVIDNNIQNVVAITGDIHTFFAGTATTSGDEGPTSRPAFPEFVGGSATSTGLPEATGFPPAALEALLPFNGQIDYFDFVKRGYGVVEASANSLTCELKSVNALQRNSPQATTLAKFLVPKGVRTPQRIA